MCCYQGMHVVTTTRSDVDQWVHILTHISCRSLYYFVVYLYVSRSGSITSVGEERANLSAVVYL